MFVLNFTSQNIVSESDSVGMCLRGFSQS